MITYRRINRSEDVYEVRGDDGSRYEVSNRLGFPVVALHTPEITTADEHVSRWLAGVRGSGVPAWSLASSLNARQTKEQP
jgi:hypothetical protein